MYERPPTRKRRWLLIGAITLAFFTCMAVSTLARHTDNNDAASTPTQEQQPTPTQEQPTATTATPRSTPMPSPTFIATHGQPHLGGPVSDFVGAYGQPLDTSRQPYNFSVDADTIVSVDLAKQTVRKVSVSGPDTWSDSKTRQYCAQFYPPGASLRGSAGDGSLYDSDLGRFSAVLMGTGACMVFFVES